MSRCSWPGSWQKEGLPHPELPNGSFSVDQFSTSRRLTMELNAQAIDGVVDPFAADNLPSRLTARYTVDPAPDTSWLLEPEGEELSIPCEEIPRLAVHRGEYRIPKIIFRSSAFPIASYPDWLDHLYTLPHLEDIVEAVGIWDALDSSRYRNIPSRHSQDLTLFCLRWIPGLHTALTAHGEVTLVLEDIAAYTGLPLHGNTPFQGCCTSTAMRPEDQEIYNLLKKGRDACEKSSYASWVKYWAPSVEVVGEERVFTSSPNGANNPRLQLAAFLVLWLCRDVFEYNPRDTIKLELFHMAILLSRRVSFPLAPMFLGHTYHLLDTLVHDIRDARDSCGLHEVHTFVDANLISTFLWDHFPDISPDRNELQLTSMNGDEVVNVSWPRTALYRGKRQSMKKTLKDFIDVPAYFVARPYGDGAVGGTRYRFAMRGKNTDGAMLSSTKVRTHKDNDFVLAVTPGMIPGFRAGSFSAEAYNVQRCARQVLFDQGVPSSSFPPSDVQSHAVEAAFNRFVYCEGSVLACRSVPFDLRIPHESRKPLVRGNYYSAWLRVSGQILSYLRAPRIPLPPLTKEQIKAVHLVGRVKFEKGFATKHGLKSSNKGRADRDVCWDPHQAEAAGGKKKKQKLVGPSAKAVTPRKVQKVTHSEVDFSLCPWFLFRLLYLVSFVFMYRRHLSVIGPNFFL